MLSSLAFDFPETEVMSGRGERGRVACSGAAWLVAASADEMSSIGKLLRGGSGYKHFFVVSRNGRRRISEGDLIVLADGSNAFSAFVCGAAPDSGQAERLRAMIESSFQDRSVVLVDRIPIEMLVVGLSPFGRRHRRRQDSRTTLERTFDSLQCKEILANPYLKERLSRTILEAAPKPVDPLLNAIFCRLRADGLLGVQRKTEIDVDEAVSLYRAAADDFAALDLKAQAAECARRLRLVQEIVHSKSQPNLPGFVGHDRTRALGDLGFMARRCVAVRVEFSDSRFKQMTFERREHGTSHSIDGQVAIGADDLQWVLRTLDDPISIPVVSAGQPSSEDGALTFDLEVRIRQRFAARLGLDLPLSSGSSHIRDGLWGVYGSTCRQVGIPTDLDENGYAKVRLAVSRSGRHRVQLRLSEGLVARRFPVTFQLSPSM